jgi:hypothetical protein
VGAVVVGGVVGGSVGLLGASGRLPHTGSSAVFLIVLGMLAGVAVSTLLLALAAALTGALSPLYASVGVGRWLGSLRVGGVLVAVRLLPLVPFNPCLAAVRRPGLRGRLWGAVAGSTLLTLAAAVCLGLSGDGAVAALGWGMGVMTLVMSVSGLNRPLSRGWVLWRLPTRAGAEALPEWAADPATLRAARLLAQGRVAAAAAELNAAAPADGARRPAVAAAVAVAAGRFDEAARAAHASAAAASAPALRTAALATYAGALGGGVATRLWAPEEARAGFAAAVASIRAHQPVVLQVTAVGALESLFAGDLAQAVLRAGKAASLAPDAFSRAQAFAVQAVALRAGSQPDEAAKALAKARRLAPDAELLAPAG